MSALRSYIVPARCPPDRYLDYLFGYAVVKGVSARASRCAGQWVVSNGRADSPPHTLPRPRATR